MQDRDLVAAIVAGDPAGLAAAYDRYAPALYTYCRSMLRDAEDAADALQDTFVVAAQKLDGLRDPDRLRPWLYAVARNECLRRVRARQSTVQLDQAAEVSDDAVDVEAGLREADVRGLIWSAIQGLNPGEREVFELSVRHELEGADLAAALGVSANHAHALLSRARGQLEKSLGALLVARTGRAECDQLAAILEGWDGELTALLRKRINRHVEQCDVCGERKRRELRPEALLGAMPLLLLPPGLRANVMRMVGDVLPHANANADGNGGANSETARTGPTSANVANGALGAAATANLAEYCAQVARRAEPFDREGFPVPLERRRRPLAAARRKSLIAAAILLVLLLGVGGYSTLRYLSPGNTAATVPALTHSAITVVDTGPSLVIELSTSAAVSASASASPSASVSPSQPPSPSPSASPTIVVVVTSARPSRSPSRSPSPSPPPPPPGVLLADPTNFVATYYAGRFNLTASGGAVPGFTIIPPPPQPNYGTPYASPSTGGTMKDGQVETITVYAPGYAPEVFTVQPDGNQPPIYITASPYYPIS